MEMSSDRRKDELQIELAEIQMMHQEWLGSFLGLLAVAFTVFGGLNALYYAPHLIHLRYFFLISMVGIVFVLIVILWFFSKRLKEIREKTKKLREKYLW